MSQDRFTLRASVYLLLIRDQTILLQKRSSNVWGGGQYGLVSGHLEKGETITGALVREVKEETGLELLSSSLRVVHTMRRHDEIDYVDFFLITTKWQGEPVNKEPTKCEELRWSPLQSLPKNTLPYIIHAIQSYIRGETFSEFGW